MNRTEDCTTIADYRPYLFDVNCTGCHTHHLFRDKTYLQTGDTCSRWLPHFSSSYAIHADAFKISIYSLQNFFRHIINTATIRLYSNFTTTTMETAEYWPMAWEYSIWNAAIASLQFWTEHLNPVTLSIATECIYTTFFWTSTSHTLCQQSEEPLFGCFVIALNTAFTQQLSLADEGYKSGSDTVDLPSPLQKTPCKHHISSVEHASFNPVHTTPCNTVTMTPRSSPQTSYQTSVLPLILQLRYWSFPRQHSSMFRQFRWRGRRFSDSTTGWWALDLGGHTWKNFLHTWTWITT